jgi:hypothetical protein
MAIPFVTTLDDSAFQRGLKNMENKTKSASDKIASSFTDAAKGGVASLAAAFSVGAIVAFGKSVMDFAGDLQDSSDAMGITTDALQGLNAVFLAGGSDAETTKKGLITLTRSLQDIATTADGPARKALDALGISFADIAGLTADEAMYVIADAMKGATDKGAALDAAMTLLGKSASKMAPALFGGAAAMREIAATNPDISDADIKAIADMGDAWDALGTSIKVATANAFGYFSKIKTETTNSQGGEAASMASIGGGFGGGFGALTNVDFSKTGQPVNEGAAAFEAESLAIGAETKTVKMAVDPRIKAEQDAKMAAIEKEGAAMEKAVAARDKAEADSAASQLTLSEQLQEAGVKTLELQEYIASSEGIDQVNAQTELIKLEQTKIDLVEKVAKAKADEAKKAQDLFQQNLDRENAAKADAFKDEMDKQKAIQQGKQKNAEEDMKLADENLAAARQNLEDVFTGKTKKPTKAETKLADQMRIATGEDVVQANKFGAEGGLGTKQLDATGKVIKGLGSTGGLGGPARKDMPQGSRDAIARFNLAKQRQEAAKGNLTKTNEILDLINKGINGAK